jgi:hypothetical protein
VRHFVAVVEVGAKIAGGNARRDRTRSARCHCRHRQRPRAMTPLARHAGRHLMWRKTMTAERPIIEFGIAPPAFADRLVIEQHGAASHLIFCHDQRETPGQREWPGQERIVSVVDCRVIVPTVILPQLARQLACPEIQEPIEGARRRIPATETGRPCAGRGGPLLRRPGRGKRAHSNLLPPMLPRSNFCLSWLAARGRVSS